MGCDREMIWDIGCASFTASFEAPLNGFEELYGLLKFRPSRLLIVPSCL